MLFKKTCYNAFVSHLSDDPESMGALAKKIWITETGGDSADGHGFHDLNGPQQQRIHDE